MPTCGAGVPPVKSQARRLCHRDKKQLVNVAAAAFVLTAACLAASPGCAHVNNPFKDSSAEINPEMTTASAEGFKGKREFYVPLHRHGVRSVAYYENGSVTHWPLWFEDPFEYMGNDLTAPDERDMIDNRFAWNWVDYMHWAYGPGRFAVNTILWPVSAVVTPPGTLMESDGYLHFNFLCFGYDAKRSAPAMREPPDGHHLSRDMNLRAAESPTAADPVKPSRDEGITNAPTAESAPSE